MDDGGILSRLQPKDQQHLYWEIMNLVNIHFNQSVAVFLKREEREQSI